MIQRSIFGQPTWQYLLVVLFAPVGALVGFRVGDTNLGYAFPRVLGLLSAGLIVVELIRRRLQAGAMKLPRLLRFVALPAYSAALALSFGVSATSIARNPRGFNLYDRVAGFLPYSDAGGYYAQVIQGPTADFDSFNSRRPLNAMIRLVHDYIAGGNLLAIHLVQVSLLALSIVALTCSLVRYVRWPLSIVAGLIVSLWAWPFASSFLTEANAITISSASLALCLYAARVGSYKLGVLGCYGLLIAVLLRPFSPLLPVLTLIALLIVLRKTRQLMVSRWAVALSAIPLLIFPIIIPSALSSLYSPPEVRTSNGNLGVVLLGVARNSNWAEADRYIRQRWPELGEASLDRQARAEAATLFVNNPQPAAAAMFKNGVAAVARFVSELPPTLGASSFCGTATGDVEGRAGCLLGSPIFWLSIALLILVIAGLVLGARSSLPIAYFAIGGLLAYGMAAPVVFGDGGWRSTATLFPLLAIVIVAGVAGWASERTSDSLRSLGLKYDGEYSNFGFIVVPTFALLLIAVTLAVPYPAISRTLNWSGGTAGQTFVIKVENGASPKWSSWNSGQTSLETFINWSEINGLHQLNSWLIEYGPYVRNIAMDEDSGNVVIGVSSDLPMGDDLPLDLDGGFTIQHD